MTARVLAPHKPTSRHLDVLSGLLMTVGTGGNLANDAHLAALAVEHGAEIVTYDSDFGRFAECAGPHRTRCEFVHRRLGALADAVASRARERVKARVGRARSDRGTSR